MYPIHNNITKLSTQNNDCENLLTVDFVFNVIPYKPVTIEAIRKAILDANREISSVYLEKVTFSKNHCIIIEVLTTEEPLDSLKKILPGVPGSWSDGQSSYYICTSVQRNFGKDVFEIKIVEKKRINFLSSLYDAIKGEEVDLKKFCGNRIYQHEILIYFHQLLAEDSSKAAVFAVQACATLMRVFATNEVNNLWRLMRKVLAYHTDAKQLFPYLFCHFEQTLSFEEVYALIRVCWDFTLSINPKPVEVESRTLKIFFWRSDRTWNSTLEYLIKKKRESEVRETLHCLISSIFGELWPKIDYKDVNNNIENALTPLALPTLFKEQLKLEIVEHYLDISTKEKIPFAKEDWFCESNLPICSLFSLIKIFWNITFHLSTKSDYSEKRVLILFIDQIGFNVQIALESIARARYTIQARRTIELLIKSIFSDLWSTISLHSIRDAFTNANIPDLVKKWILQEIAYYYLSHSLEDTAFFSNEDLAYYLLTTKECPNHCHIVKTLALRFEKQIKLNPNEIDPNAKRTIHSLIRYLEPSYSSDFFLLLFKHKWISENALAYYLLYQNELPKKQIAPKLDRIAKILTLCSPPCSKRFLYPIIRFLEPYDAIHFFISLLKEDLVSDQHREATYRLVIGKVKRLSIHEVVDLGKNLNEYIRTTDELLQLKLIKLSNLVVNKLKKDSPGLEKHFDHSYFDEVFQDEEDKKPIDWKILYETLNNYQFPTHPKLEVSTPVREFRDSFFLPESEATQWPKENLDLDKKKFNRVCKKANNLSEDNLIEHQQLALDKLSKSLVDEKQAIDFLQNLSNPDYVGKFEKTSDLLLFVRNLLQLIGVVFKKDFDSDKTVQYSCRAFEYTLKNFSPSMEDFTKRWDELKHFNSLLNKKSRADGKDYISAWFIRITPLIFELTFNPWLNKFLYEWMKILNEKNALSASMTQLGETSLGKLFCTLFSDNQHDCLQMLISLVDQSKESYPTLYRDTCIWTIRHYSQKEKSNFAETNWLSKALDIFSSLNHEEKKLIQSRLQHWSNDSRVRLKIPELIKKAILVECIDPNSLKAALNLIWDSYYEKKDFVNLFSLYSIKWPEKIAKEVMRALNENINKLLNSYKGKQTPTQEEIDFFPTLLESDFSNKEKVTDFILKYGNDTQLKIVFDILTHEHPSWLKKLENKLDGFWRQIFIKNPAFLMNEVIVLIQKEEWKKSYVDSALKSEEHLIAFEAILDVILKSEDKAHFPAIHGLLSHFLTQYDTKGPKTLSNRIQEKIFYYLIKNSVQIKAEQSLPIINWIKSYFSKMSFKECSEYLLSVVETADSADWFPTLIVALENRISESFKNCPKVWDLKKVKKLFNESILSIPNPIHRGFIWDLLNLSTELPCCNKKNVLQEISFKSFIRHSTISELVSYLKKCLDSKVSGTQAVFISTLTQMIFHQLFVSFNLKPDGLTSDAIRAVFDLICLHYSFPEQSLPGQNAGGLYEEICKLASSLLASPVTENQSLAKNMFEVILKNAFANKKPKELLERASLLFRAIYHEYKKSQQPHLNFFEIINKYIKLTIANFNDFTNNSQKIISQLICALYANLIPICKIEYFNMLESSEKFINQSGSVFTATINLPNSAELLNHISMTILHFNDYHKIKQNEKDKYIFAIHKFEDLLSQGLELEITTSAYCYYKFCMLAIHFADWIYDPDEEKIISKTDEKKIIRKPDEKKKISKTFAKIRSITEKGYEYWFSVVNEKPLICFALESGTLLQADKKLHNQFMAMHISELLVNSAVNLQVNEKYTFTKVNWSSLLQSVICALPILYDSAKNCQNFGFFLLPLKRWAEVLTQPSLVAFNFHNEQARLLSTIICDYTEAFKDNPVYNEFSKVCQHLKKYISMQYDTIYLKEIDFNDEE